MSRQRVVLITGAAGFLGSHLADRLLDTGCEVVGVDNLSTGAQENIHHLTDHPNFEFVRHDITLPLHIEADIIYNLASPASPVWYQLDPVQTMKTIVLGAINMLGLAKATGAKIIQASTSEVYGDPLVSPQHETYWGNVNPVGPRACYDEGKRAAETLFTDFRRQYSVDTRIARIFNTYGPRMAVEDGRVISNFVVQALLQRPLTVFGDGSQTRSFCFVNDLVDALVRFGLASEVPDGPINFGNPTEITVSEVAELVIDMTSSSSSIEYLPLPVDDPVRRRPDTARARDILGWRATTPLAVGLTATIEYFRGRVLDGAQG